VVGEMNDESFQKIDNYLKIVMLVPYTLTIRPER
jgi:hypothetical protein